MEHGLFVDDFPIRKPGLKMCFHPDLARSSIIYPTLWKTNIDVENPPIFNG
jgi:hypothetical protein